MVRSVSSRHIFRGSDWSRAPRLDSKKEIIIFNLLKIRILAIWKSTGRNWTVLAEKNEKLKRKKICQVQLHGCPVWRADHEELTMPQPQLVTGPFRHFYVNESYGMIHVLWFISPDMTQWYRQKSVKIGYTDDDLIFLIREALTP